MHVWFNFILQKLYKKVTYLDSLHLKFDVTMLVAPIELGVPINIVNGSDMMSYKRKYLFPCLFIHIVLLPRIGVLRKALPDMPPYKRVSLYVQGTRVLNLLPAPRSSFPPTVRGTLVFIRFPRVLVNPILLIADGQRWRRRSGRNPSDLLVFPRLGLWHLLDLDVVVDSGVLDAVHPLDDLVRYATAADVALVVAFVGVLDVLVVIDDGVECAVGVLGEREVVMRFFDVVCAPLGRDYLAFEDAVDYGAECGTIRFT